ncbi:hypothetical protein HMPREF9004_0658 [Schaalia cardiffensis F0333]|uniref:Uncharacterized protein n=1 Tax=Schaalia cardiffensis F0333 TaxID=888050 RepID=N6WED2_9ACTO|nr:hypothetical protein HMPREF9004_0658 [Schaalia cardiffensis F0333]
MALRYAGCCASSRCNAYANSRSFVHDCKYSARCTCTGCYPRQVPHPHQLPLEPSPYNLGTSAPVLAPDTSNTPGATPTPDAHPRQPPPESSPSNLATSAPLLTPGGSNTPSSTPTSDNASSLEDHANSPGAPIDGEGR